MTTLAYRDSSFFGNVFSPSTGASECARRGSELGARRFLDYVRTARGQLLFADPRQALAKQLRDIEESVAAGEARTPSGAAVQEAHALIDSLPETLARPQPHVEPSGAISFEWDYGKDRYVILAVKGTGVLEYSVAMGPGDRQWGVRNFGGRIDEASIRLLVEIGVAESAR